MNRDVFKVSHKFWLVKRLYDESKKIIRVKNIKNGERIFGIKIEKL